MKSKIILGKLFLVSLLSGPAALVHGQAGEFDEGPFIAFLEAVNTIIDMLIPILIGLALIVFFWGLIKFITSAGDEEARAKGKQLMIWGVIALVIMVAIWGILTWILSVLGVDSDAGAIVPDSPFGS